jgi:GTP-binding protein
MPFANNNISIISGILMATTLTFQYAHSFTNIHIGGGLTRSSPTIVHTPSLSPFYHNSNLHQSSKAKASAEGEKLTRPQRKAQERMKKASKKNNKGSSVRQYNLHSNKVSALTKASSTADDVITAIKRAQKRHDVHDIRNIAKFLLNEVDASFAYGYRGSLVARLAVAALHMNEHESARAAIEVRKAEHRDSMLPMESAAIIRGLLRVHNVTDAIELLDDELALPSEGTPLDTDNCKELIKQRASSLGSVASRHFFEGEPCMAVKACGLLQELGPTVFKSGLTAEELNMPWTRIISGAAECESKGRDGSVIPCDPFYKLPCNLVYAVVNAMTAFPSDNDDRIYEILANALIRRTVFITGAVSMDGCPEADRGEVVFIGRSNVGKSSLVNMITNRKSLAFTSKRPGKTQQFNYFAVNDKPGKEKEVRYGDVLDTEKDLDSFYIVDVPGFGYAKVPDELKKEWSLFLADYAANRKTLRVVFHLIDARHGPTAEDNNIMKQMGEILPKAVKYVVVLTKSDKNVKGPSPKNSGKVSESVMNAVRDALKENGVKKAPILLTSAETKLGRDEMWKYMRLAAEV